MAEEKAKAREIDGILDAEGYTPISKGEIEAAELITLEAEKLRRERQEMPPVQVEEMQGQKPAVIQSFFNMPPPRNSRVGYARRLELNREQTIIINSAITALQNLSPDQWRDAFNRYEESLVEICRFFAGLTPEDIRAAKNGNDADIPESKVAE